MPRLSEQKRAVLESMTRDALYEASLSILEAEGWMGLTMEKLAQRAGVAKGTVYNYFPDKKEIIFFVLRRNGENITREMEAIRSLGLDPATELQRTLESLVLGIHKHRNVIAAMIRVVEENPELHSHHGPCSKEHPMHRVREALLAVLTRGVQCGAFRDFDPNLMENLIHGILMSLARMFGIGAFEGDPEVIAEMVKDLVLHGILPRKGTDA